MEPWEEQELIRQPSGYDRLLGPAGSRRRVATRLMLIYAVSFMACFMLSRGNTLFAAVLGLLPFFVFAMLWLYIMTMCGLGLGIIRLWGALCRAVGKTAWQ